MLELSSLYIVFWRFDGVASSPCNEIPTFDFSHETHTTEQLSSVAPFAFKYFCSRKRSPLGPSIAVRSLEVCAYERFKTTKQHKGVGCGSHVF